MVNKSILLLCHGERHDLEGCPTTGIPLTMKVLKDMYTIDKNEGASPDLVTDWSKPIKISNKFEIVTTRCCMYHVFVNTKGDLDNTSFKNVEKVLKIGGYFIFSMAPYGLEKFGKYLLRKGYYKENIKNLKDQEWLESKLPEWKGNRKVKLPMKKSLMDINRRENDDKLHKQLLELMVMYVENKYKKLKLIRKKSEMDKFNQMIGKKYMTINDTEDVIGNYNKYKNCWYFMKTS